MVAHSAVRSLMQALDVVLNPARGRRIYHNRAQLRSLHEKVSFLQGFLENPSSDYRKCNDMELESVETKIRHAAYEALTLIEYGISNQILTPVVDPVTTLIFTMLMIPIVVELPYLAFDTLIAPWIPALFPILHTFLILVQFLLPVCLQDVLLVMARILNLLVLYSLEHFFVMSVLVFSLGELIESAVRSFARYWRYASQPENRYLCKAIDDFSVIVKEVIKIKDARGSGQNMDSQRSGSTDSLSRGSLRDIGNNVVVGLESELKEIFDRLLGDQPELQVMSIVGLGGIGKTTLATKVHDAPHIVYHFDVCAWITVSQKYSLRHVMLGLLNSAKIRTEEILQSHNQNDDVLDQKLGEHLYRNLTRRRYLIVMDDVWDTKIWDFVRMFFPNNSNGSRVLLTTRLSEVSSYANSGSTSIHMQFLNDDDSWNILSTKVFGGEGCPPELEVIGRTIARNCKGLPLAIVVVGGLLYNKHKTVQDWEYVSNNLKSILNEDDTQCPDILGLSYNHLSHCLKPCFLYMGSFCEDEEIHVTRLFNLWAAEGFVEASKDKSLEEVGDKYLKELIQRSLIMVGKWSCNGKIKTCKIHDLVRDFCWRTAWKEEFISYRIWGRGNDEAGIWHRVRTLFDCANASCAWSGSYIMARSFIYTGRMFDDLSYIYCFGLLRVLDVVPANLHELPDAIFKLVQLRYLGVTYNYRLPPAISQLWNLQTIVYHGGRFDSSLMIPVEVWSLPNLRHLYFRGDFLPDPPSFWFQLHHNSVVLENLQTLVGISNFRCTKKNFKSIPHLNKLGISYDGSSFAKCQLESLVSLLQLQNLKITMRSVLNPPKLGFPQKLKKLSLSGCRMPWESMTIIGALPDLQVLKLRNYAFEGQIWEPIEGEFCELMFLQVEDTDLEEWRADENHFPHLKRLVLRRCYELEEIPFGIGEISALERIELVDCHPSAVASVRLIQEEHQSNGDEHLKVQIHTS